MRTADEADVRGVRGDQVESTAVCGWEVRSEAKGRVAAEGRKK